MGPGYEGHTYVLCLFIVVESELSNALVTCRAGHTYIPTVGTNLNILPSLCGQSQQGRSDYGILSLKQFLSNLTVVWGEGLISFFLNVLT